MRFVYINTYRSSLLSILHRYNCTVILDPAFKGAASDTHRTVTMHNSLDEAEELAKVIAPKHFIMTLAINVNEEIGQIYG